MNDNFRIEKDSIGNKELPKNCMWGINTERALENFEISSRKVPTQLIHAFGQVKLACARTNQKYNYINENLGISIQNACNEMINGNLDKYIVVDAYQGGAGTSTNLNVCEVLANRTLEIMNKNKGNYEFCDPIEHINMHQSTNDTYPTALRIALYSMLQKLENEIIVLQEALQQKEKEYYSVIKMGRTELMDAHPTTLGKEFSAWAEVLSRDRWRIYKSTERLRVINLGGTAIGTGLGAPREYIFKVTDELRAITGIPLSRAENLFEATQNQDSLLEVMGMIKTHAMNLFKISNDIRLLNMGPDTGLMEIEIPKLQVGSSIMPNKVNPVIPEAIAQIAIQISAYDQAVTWAIASGQLELNAFLPLVALNMIEALELLISANKIAANKCIKGIRANVDICYKKLIGSQAIATVLIPHLGYNKTTLVAKAMKEKGLTFFEAAYEIAGLSQLECEKLITPEAINALGFTRDVFDGNKE